MILLLVASWLGSIACMLAYAYLVKTGNLHHYNVVNFVAAPPLVLAAGVTGLWPNALLSAFYGVVAAVGIWRERRNNIKGGNQ